MCRSAMTAKRSGYLRKMDKKEDKVYYRRMDRKKEQMYVCDVDGGMEKMVGSRD